MLHARRQKEASGGIVIFQISEFRIQISDSYFAFEMLYFEYHFLYIDTCKMLNPESGIESEI